MGHSTGHLHQSANPRMNEKNEWSQLMEQSNEDRPQGDLKLKQAGGAKNQSRNAPNFDL